MGLSLVGHGHGVMDCPFCGGSGRRTVGASTTDYEPCRACLGHGEIVFHARVPTVADRPTERTR